MIISIISTNAQTQEMGLWDAWELYKDPLLTETKSFFFWVSFILILSELNPSKVKFFQGVSEVYRSWVGYCKYLWHHYDHRIASADLALVISLTEFHNNVS